jgi:hypothetical protein
MLALHVASSVGWLGAVVTYIALNVVAAGADDEKLVRAAFLMMKPVAWYAVLPLASTSLVTGIVQSLGTRWKLFRHYWVLVSLVLTGFATVTLLLRLPDVDALAARAADPTTDADRLNGDLFHSIGGLVVLLLLLMLNLYKPRGLTRYGRRKQQEQLAGARTQQLSPSASSAPPQQSEEAPPPSSRCAHAPLVRSTTAPSTATSSRVSSTVTLNALSSPIRRAGAVEGEHRSTALRRGARRCGAHPARWPPP